MESTVGNSPLTWNSEIPNPLSIDHLRDLARVLLDRHNPIHPALVARTVRLRALVKGASSDSGLLALASWDCDYTLFSGIARECFPEHVARHIWVERQVSALFSKLTFGSIDRKVVALRSFLASEEKCRETNHLLRSARLGHLSLDPGTCSALYRAKQLIQRVLGDCPSLEGMHFRFGPGATTSVKRKDASPISKAMSVATCAAPLYSRIGTVFSGAPHLLRSLLSGAGPARGDLDVRIAPAVWDSVPKNFKTERGICKEPDLNVVVQGFLGRLIEQRLRARAGIDIRDQTRNQRLAHQASISGELATLDLSAASDSVATELVFELLPLDWAILLASARSDTVRLPDGSVIRQEKFSSMGNGFTFPLETLLFWGISTAAMDHGSAVVYGDDIVVPTGDAANVVRVLSILGFSVNDEKSFIDSDVIFRESCGCDYFGGYDVRPVYVRGDLSPRRCATMFNYFAERHDWEVCYFLYSRFLTDAPHGPPGHGDGHLSWSPFCASDPRVPYKRELGFEGFLISSYRPRPIRKELDVDFLDACPDIVMTSVLYAQESRPHGLDIQSSMKYQGGVLTVALPGIDGDCCDEYHRKRLHVTEDIPDLSWSLPGYTYAGRRWTLLFKCGSKPRLIPERRDERPRRETIPS